MIALQMAQPLNYQPNSPEAPDGRILPGAYVSISLLLGINLVNYIDRYVIAAVNTHVKAELLQGWQNPDFMVGLLGTAFMVSYMIFSPLFGWMGDRMSRWPLIGLGVIIWSIATAACGLAQSIWVLLALRALVGIGEAAYGPTAPTIISDLFPVKRRGTFVSIFYIAIPVGSALGYMIGGVVADYWSWHWAFFVVGPPGIVLGLWALFMRDPPRGGSEAVQTTYEKASFKQYAQLLRIPSYVLNNAAMTALTFCMGGVAFWAPDYIASFRKAGTLAEVGQIFGLLTVIAGLSATLLGGWLADRLRGEIRGSYFIVSGVAMLVGFPFYLGTLFLPFPWAWGCMFVAMFCMFFNTGPSNTALLNVVHPSMRSAAFALCIFIIRLLGDAISPSVIGLISDLSTLQWGMASVSVMMVVAGVVWILAAPYLEEDTRKALISPPSVDSARTA